MTAVKLLRFREWYYFLALPLAGVDTSVGACRNGVALARGVAIAFCVLAFGYLVNSASDVESDLDARKNPLVGRDASGWVWIASTILATTAAAFAATGPRASFVGTAICLVSGLVYSVGPRVKTVPVLGTLTNATNFVPLLWVGAVSADVAMAWWLAPAFAGLLLQSQIFHEAADADVDTRGGVRTTFLAIGRTWSAWLAAAFGALPVLVHTGAVARAGIIATYVVGFPVALAVVASDPERAATLRKLHRLSGLAFGAALFLHRV